MIKEDKILIYETEYSTIGDIHVRRNLCGLYRSAVSQYNWHFKKNHIDKLEEWKNKIEERKKDLNFYLTFGKYRSK